MEQDHYVVIFKSQRSKDQEGYAEMDAETMRLVEQQQGFLWMDSYSNDENKNVTIVAFQSEEDVLAWKKHPVHQEAQRLGIEKWYDYYSVHVCKVTRAYEFKRK